MFHSGKFTGTKASTRDLTRQFIAAINESGIGTCVVMLLNVHGQQLRSCWDGQLT